MIKCFGVTYRVHPLFVVIMALSAAVGYFVELITLFGIVIIHELGHAVAAHLYGWKVRDIQLLPFGGVATMEDRARTTAWEEMVVALAGPLQNIWMIGIALLMQTIGAWEGEWVDYFIRANAAIALFNLLPALPLDGGRIAQAWLSWHFPYFRVLLIANWLGIAASVGMTAAAFALLRDGIQLNLLLIGLFVLATNAVELKDMRYRFMRFLIHRGEMADSLAERGGLAAPLVVRGASTPLAVAKQFVREKYHLIYVLDDEGEIRAVVPEHRLMYAMFVEKQPISAVFDLFMYNNNKVKSAEVAYEATPRSL